LRAAEDTLKRLRTLLTDRPNAFGRSSAFHLEGEIATRRERIATEQLYEAGAAFPIYYAHVRLAELAEGQEDWEAAITEWTRVIGSRGESCATAFRPTCPSPNCGGRALTHEQGELRTQKLATSTWLGIWQRGDDTPLRRQAADDARQLSSGGKP
jgi:hypothetical protein